MIRSSRQAIIFVCLCFTVLVAGSAARADAPITLPAIFSDHMVLQRDMPCVFFGTAEPNTELGVWVNTDLVNTYMTDAHGRWSMSVPAHKASAAPIEVTVKPMDANAHAAAPVTFHDILVGEVWLASGQSNMELPLNKASNAKAEIAAANFPNIRLFTVKRRAATQPLDNVQGTGWTACTPQSADSFSAAAYFFGRQISQDINVPVGLIHSSVGGTPAESWTSREVLTADSTLKPILDRYDTASARYADDNKAYADQIAAWETQSTNPDPGNKGADDGFAKTDFDDSSWQSVNLPALFSAAKINAGVDGAFWFRRSLDLPADWADHDLTLLIGPMKDVDVTYFNGQQVGTNGAHNPHASTVRRVYRVPANLVHAGRNVVAVRLYNSAGDGGFLETAQRFTLANPDVKTNNELSLVGPWKWHAEVTFPEKSGASAAKLPAAPVAPDDIHAPTVLFNAMIRPLIPYTIRGVIWYQGEANAVHAVQYRTLFPAMITDWRDHWTQGDRISGIGHDFPFLFVQLPNFMARQQAPANSQWAELRDAQAFTASKLPNTGMAVTIDIGEAGNIHPTNKQDVGHRLALIAENKVYGKSDVEYSGPVLESMTIVSTNVRLKFSHVGTGLVAAGGHRLQGFAVASHDKKFALADANIIAPDTVELGAEIVEFPLVVRYAWADNPVANLYNSAGLPAAPFRTDDFPLITAGKE